MHDSNTEQLIATAELLRPLLGDLVFVGGAGTRILVTDTGAGAPRVTLDVDAIAEITLYVEYAAFGQRLRAAGFREDTTEGAPLCRWVQQGLVLDVMPLNEKILGFSSRWYHAALRGATRHSLSPDLEVRVITGPHYVATKMEAFRGRGNGDFFGSHDLEDLIFVIDGRPSIVYELRSESRTLRAYLRTHIKDLLATPAFLDAVPGFLRPDAASQARIGSVLGRLETIASL